MIHFEKKVLSNGLTVIAEQDRSTPMSAINVLYKVGSRNEDPDKTGMAHLFEHLMFGGSLHAPDFDFPLQNAGGENNAFTNNDYTNYYEVVPSQNIELAMWLEADRMCNLMLTEESLSVQQKVIMEEYNEVCLNKPYGDSWHHLSSMSYTSHPYRWPTIGKDPSHIFDASLDDVQEFYSKFYKPNNAILSISGPLPTHEVFELAEKWFGHIPRGNDVSPSFDQELLQSETVEKTVYGDVPAALFIMSFHMPGRNSPEYYACDLLSDILANGKSSRFYNRLVRGKRIMSQVDCYVTGTIDPGLIIIEGRPMPGQTINTCNEQIWSIIDNLKSETVSDLELKKVQNKVISSLAISDLNVLNKAISLSYFEWLGSIELMNAQEELYEQVTPESLREVANKYLNKQNMCLLNYLPDKNGRFK